VGEEIDFEYGRFSDFEDLMTLTLDQVTWHTLMQHSTASTYTPNFIRIRPPAKTFADGQTYIQTADQPY